MNTRTRAIPICRYHGCGFSMREPRRPRDPMTTSAPVLERGPHLVELADRRLLICVDEADDSARGQRHRAADAAPLASAGRAADDDDRIVGPGFRCRRLARAIVAVGRDDDLTGQTGGPEIRPDLLDGGRNAPDLVVGRHDHGDVGLNRRHEWSSGLRASPRRLPLGRVRP